MKRKGKGKQKAARREAEKATRRAKKNGPESEQTQAVAGALLVQPVIDQEDARPLIVRPHSQAMKVAGEGKKYINVLVDAELQLEVRVRMTTRKLTWDTLIGSLFRRWLEENPEFRPKS